MRRQVFHLSLRTRRRPNYASNREFKPSRSITTSTPFLDDSNEPLLHFVDETCIDDNDNDNDRNDGHFKRQHSNLINCNNSEIVMFFKSRMRKSKSWSASANVIRQTRQIEVLHGSHEDGFTCGKNTEYGSGNGSNGISNAITGSDQPTSLLNFAISELVNTEQSYVRELQSIVDFYIRPFEAPENEHLIVSHLRDRSDILFGNIPDLECQKRAGHPLPLSAYLLKPVQRITKYQLLLKEVHRHCGDHVKPHVDQALSSMLDLLAQLNTAMHQLHIAGFAGDLSQIGPLRLQNECDIYAYKKRTRRLNKAQRRQLFLFDGGLLFCKNDHNRYRMLLNIMNINYPYRLGFSETSKTSPSRFEVWDETKNEAYVVQPIDESARIKWIQRLYRIVGERVTHRDRLNQQHRSARPQSWASTISTDSIRSSDTTTDSSVMDGNGNNPNGTCCSSPSSGSPTFVPAASDEDPDNNMTTTNDPLQTRSCSCPENSLGGLTTSLSSSSSTAAAATTTTIIPSSGVLNTLIPSSLLAKSITTMSPTMATTTTTTTTTPLNTIVESSSSTELFATI
ncbi:RhoGEF domain-containing protein [Dirofilaria immitis]|nr:RhoGEF domain-containing protein [Dirofilaria immitis]